jgi:hypothetical protein
MVKVDLLLFECLLHHAQPCTLCEWTALWDKVEPILRDQQWRQAAPPVTDDLQRRIPKHMLGLSYRRL